MRYSIIIFLTALAGQLLTLMACAADVALAKPTGAKWHPGHYVNGYYGNGSPDWVLKLVKDNQNIKGISLIHLWRDLEPSKDVYDFSKIERELAAVKAAGKQLIIQINDKTFSAKRLPCVPDYLLKDPVYQGGQNVYTTPEGRFVNCVALRWIPQVQDRLIALYKALGQRFDSDPNLEAILLEEDAVSEGGANIKGYSAKGYTVQQKRGMEALAESFKNTVVYKFLNWGPNVPELFEYAYQLGLGVGGPDLIPDSNNYSYPNYPIYAGKMPLEISVQSPAIDRYLGKGNTLEKVYDFGVNDPKGLRVNHVVWDPVETPQLSFKKDILPLIDSRKGNINEGLPPNRIRSKK